MKDVTLVIEDGIKKFRSPEYNYNFNLSNGYFERWGKTEQDDPTYSPYGPEILDIEVSTICHFGCPFCYKSNTGSGHNMSFETFKKIIDSFPKYNDVHFLTQVAFGVGSIDSCPDLWMMMEYCRSINIIPNITINGDRLTDEIVQNLKSLCGAISVSKYEDKNICYDAIQRLKTAGCKQINIHQLSSLETQDACFESLDDYKNDPRLNGLNAIVFLALKQKGRGVGYSPMPYTTFKGLVSRAVELHAPIGFDSCGCSKLLEVAVEIGKYDEWIQFAEPCESCSFSSYIDTDGVFFPCSFAAECCVGTDVTKASNFMEIWGSSNTVMERNRIQDNQRKCPYFNV